MIIKGSACSSPVNPNVLRACCAGLGWNRKRIWKVQETDENWQTKGNGKPQVHSKTKEMNFSMLRRFKMTFPPRKLLTSVFFAFQTSIYALNRWMPLILRGCLVNILNIYPVITDSESAKISNCTSTGLLFPSFLGFAKLQIWWTYLSAEVVSAPAKN